MRLREQNPLLHLQPALYLFSEQDGGVAVLLAGFGAQSDKPEQEQRQTGAPDHQLPVIVILQERFMDVEKLEEDGEADWLSRRQTCRYCYCNWAPIL